MSQEQGVSDESLRTSVDRLLGEEIRPALGAHAGSITATSVVDGKITLKMLASCSACYFRRGCAENFVAPAMRSRFGEQVDFAISNAR
jgi:Fe-S cluster biogenesis protein NfuA